MLLSRTLLTVVQEFMSSLSSVPEYQAEYFHSRPSRKEWIFRESIHRLISIFSVVDLLLEGLEPPPGYHCQPGMSLSQSVLPCHRDLWEARTTGAWMRAYDAYTARRASDATLRVDTLLKSSVAGCHSTLARNKMDQDVFSDILRWCEKLDSLGTLVYMVLPLQKSRLSNSAWEESHAIAASESS
jgi:hypothetical protein